MPRIGERFIYELTWQEELGLASVCDPNRDDLAGKPRDDMRGNFRRAARRDANEMAIVEALRAAGASIAFLMGTGTPDLVVGFQGRVWLCEVKRGTAGLTPDQERFHVNWKGPEPVILRTVDDALALIREG